MVGMNKGGMGTILLLGAGAMIVATPVAAQIGSPVERTPAERECVCVQDLGDRLARNVQRATRHARIGVMLGEPADAAGRQGIRIARVPERSPGYRAGLRSGDIIVTVDGHELGSDPGAGLVDRLADVTPGDTVEVGFVRGTDERTARVVTEDAGPFRVLTDAVRIQIPAAARASAAALEGLDEALQELDVSLEATDHARARREQAVEMRMRHAHRHGLSLAAVNPELGQYFGTDRGVLVTAVADDSPLGLRSGDVILSVGGRDVRDPAHVHSILASYRDDEPIPLRIVRERRTIEVTGGR